MKSKTWQSTQSITQTQVVSTLLRLAIILSFTGLTAIAAHIKVPIPGTVVPMTLQTAVVLFSGLALRKQDGAIAQLLYVAGGTLGLPFFSGAIGLAALFGPTGGYLLGFIVAAWLCSSFRSRCQSILSTWFLTFVASLAILILGMIQLKFVLHLSWEKAFFVGFTPFIIGDLLKVSIASVGFQLFGQVLLSKKF